MAENVIRFHENDRTLKNVDSRRNKLDQMDPVVGGDSSRRFAVNRDSIGDWSRLLQTREMGNLFVRGSVCVGTTRQEKVTQCLDQHDDVLRLEEEAAIFSDRGFRREAEEGESPAGAPSRKPY